MRESSKITVLKAAVHCTIWIILFFGPILFMKIESGNKSIVDIGHLIIPIIEFLSIFYLNYLILIDRFVFRQKRYGLFILLNLIIILVFRFDNIILHFFQNDFAEHSRLKKDRNTNDHLTVDIFKNILLLLLPLILSLMLKSLENFFTLQTEKREIENKSLQSELQNLKYQLQPHFFFNSLNNIYSLIELSPTRAQEAIHGLSKLMRYLLYDTGKERIKLSQEIIFLEKYIELMELRQTDKTRISFDFPLILTKDYDISPLLFISIVENAFKHGISPMHTSKMEFLLKVKENNIEFIASNNNYPKDQSDKSGSGLGLENLKKRLELIYPRRHELMYGVSDNVFHISLKIIPENQS
jgi:sensor histidine kinase YesM